MAVLQVRDIDDRLYGALKGLAKRENRSLSQEVVHILEAFMARPKAASGPTDDFLALAGTWKDERSAQEIVKDLRALRRNSKRFGDGHGVFD